MLKNSLYDGPAKGSEGSQDGSEAARRPDPVNHRRVLLREVNERINEIAGGLGLADRFSILCECGSGDCLERFELTRADYEQVRRTPTHFALVRGHDTPAIERVVQEHEAFVTVQTFG